MNKKELELILKNGEGQFIEFKENLDKTFPKEIVAFSNSSGGRPYSSKEGFFIRTGPNSQKIGRDEIISLSLNSMNAKYDANINENASIEYELEEKEFEKFANKYLGINEYDSYIFESLKIAKGNFLTNAGILLFGKNPKKYNLGAYTDCILFKGKDKVNVIDRKTFEGNIFAQLKGTMQFLKRHLNLSYEFKDEYRIEKYEIPIRALEEGVVNALIHRDYTVSGSNIFIEIYDDRVEIINPGKLLDGIDESNFGRLSLRRNEIIADVMAKTPFVEKIGSGIRRIKDLCLENGNRIKFEFNFFFTLIIYKKTIGLEKNVSEKDLEKTPQKTLQKTPKKNLTELEMKIIKILDKNPKYTREDIANALNLSSYTIKEYIFKIKEKGFLERVGGKKTGYWKVINSEEEKNE